MANDTNGKLSKASPDTNKGVENAIQEPYFCYVVPEHFAKFGGIEGGVRHAMMYLLNALNALKRVSPTV